MITEKFKALVHFIIYQCTDQQSRLSEINLNKALWYIDVVSYKITGLFCVTSVFIEQVVCRAELN